MWLFKLKRVRRFVYKKMLKVSNTSTFKQLYLCTLYNIVTGRELFLDLKYLPELEKIVKEHPYFNKNVFECKRSEGLWFPTFVSREDIIQEALKLCEKKLKITINEHKIIIF